jgi:hypothetical protein
LTTDQLDALLSQICAPDVRSILTNRPPRIEDERKARMAVRDALLELRAGRKLDAGERIIAIHGIGKRDGWPLAFAAVSISLASANQTATVETPLGSGTHHRRQHNE